jgi:biotin synthase-related radical SAM superfamily protein
MQNKKAPKKIRVSIGSAIVLGLSDGKLDAKPTTVYLLTYRRGKCTANCAFCPQSRTSNARADMLSRVVWPVFETSKVIPRIAEAYDRKEMFRTCIQALNYPLVRKDLAALARIIRAFCEIPISVSCQPLTCEDMKALAKSGVNRVSISLDAVTKELFDRVKGRLAGGTYSWDGHMKALKNAVAVFGRNNVSTHLIMGLGEDEDDFVRLVQKCVNMGVYPALFAFTPVSGTAMADHHAPSISSYRRIQLAQYLITHRLSLYRKMKFKHGRLVDFGLPKTEIANIVGTGEPFRTSGCPGCNRPYYNERPSGDIYNFPQKPTAVELAKIEKVLWA